MYEWPIFVDFLQLIFQLGLLVRKEVRGIERRQERMRRENSGGDDGDE